jgi:pilus assembly protein CpaE
VAASQGISILIAQSDDLAREELIRILSAAEDMEVVGAIRDGDAAIALARKLDPDIVLVDYDLLGKDGIETTEAISTMLPTAAVILLSTDMHPDVLRRAMVAGARQFLQIPPAPEELLRTIYQVHDTTAARRSISERSENGSSSKRAGQIITVFSPKGGVGTTMVATNLAIAIKLETGMRVALVDGSLPFGDIGVFLDTAPTRSIMDLQVPAEQLDSELVDSALITHQRSGVKVLLAPQRPEMADMVTGDLLRRTITLLRERHEYVIVDTWSALDERVLTALETADKILLLTSLDLSAIKSAKIFLEVAELLRFPPENIKVVVTHATASTGISVTDVEATLGRSIDVRIPADDRVSRSINEGEPFLLSARNTPVAQAISDLARRLVGENYPELKPASAEGNRDQSRAPRFKLFARG